MPKIDPARRTALVTGGSAGIGRELVRQLLGAGAARVLVVGRDPRKLAETENEFGLGVVTVQADLARTEEVDRLLGDLPGLAPDLSLLFNNAGSQMLTNITQEDASRLLPGLRDEIAVNLSAPIALSVGLLPLLARQESGAIVNVTSGLALAPKMSAPVYCATKAAVRSFTRALRYQCERSHGHIQVIEALPPMVDTQMTAGRGRGKISPERCAAEILAGVQSGRREIYVGKSALLRTIMRAAPGLGYAIMRRG